MDNVLTWRDHFQRVALSKCAVACVVLVALVSTPGCDQPPPAAPSADQDTTTAALQSQSKLGTSTAALPKLLDLGAGKCIPCKKMAPILDELKEEFAGVLDVVFIDVWQHPDAGEQYGIQMIPTQIFYDAHGKELYRHEGFISKEDILAKWSELGIDLQPKATSTL